jgi:hypothetical protein
MTSNKPRKVWEAPVCTRLGGMEMTQQFGNSGKTVEFHDGLGIPNQSPGRPGGGGADS